ncbi:claudin-5 [Moschus berezovskii]|nr:claudin-5 [Moschus berezovskii]
MCRGKSVQIQGPAVPETARWSAQGGGSRSVRGHPRPLPKGLGRDQDSCGPGSAAAAGGRAVPPAPAARYPATPGSVVSLTPAAGGASDWLRTDGPARIGCPGQGAGPGGAESAPEPSKGKPLQPRPQTRGCTAGPRGLETERVSRARPEAPGRRARVLSPAMGSAALEILGLVLCLVGWVGLILACGLPMWQVTAFLDHNIVTAQTTWKGLWMSCVVQSTGHMQCKVYDSVLALSPEVQAARALTVGAVLLALVALFVTLAGAQCTTCVAPGPAKARVALSGGALYALCGLLALVPLCWFANIVVREFYDPTVPMSQKYELGAALYIGWAASALLMCGGGLVCCGAWVCTGRPDFSFPVKYSASRRPTATGDYDKKNYV